MQALPEQDPYLAKALQEVMPTLLFLVKRDSIDSNTLQPGQIVNHFAKTGHLTTKVFHEIENAALFRLLCGSLGLRARCARQHGWTMLMSTAFIRVASISKMKAIWPHLLTSFVSRPPATLYDMMTTHS